MIIWNCKRARLSSHHQTRQQQSPHKQNTQARAGALMAHHPAWVGHHTGGSRSKPPVQEELDKHKAVLRDQEHKFVAQRLTQDATQLVTASCVAENRISDCRRFSTKGAMWVPHSQAEERTGRAHGAGAQRGTIRARSGHWRRCVRSNLEREMELLFAEADVTCGNATQVAVLDSLSKARRRGRIAIGSRSSSSQHELASSQTHHSNFGTALHQKKVIHHHE